MGNTNPYFLNKNVVQHNTRRFEIQPFPALPRASRRRRRRQRIVRYSDSHCRLAAKFLLRDNRSTRVRFSAKQQLRSTNQRSFYLETRSAQAIFRVQPATDLEQGFQTFCSAAPFRKTFCCATRLTDSLVVNDTYKRLITNLKMPFCLWGNHTNAHIPRK